MPNAGKIDDLNADLEKLDVEAEKIKNAQIRHQRTLDDELMPYDVVAKKLAELKQRQESLDAKRAVVEELLKNTPTKDAIDATAQRLSQRVIDLLSNKPKSDDGKNKPKPKERSAAEKKDSMWVSTKAWLLSHSGLDLDDLNWDAKRSLIEDAFTGKDSDGRKMGVYIQGIAGQRSRGYKAWRFALSGNAALYETKGQTICVDESQCSLISRRQTR